MSVTRTRSTSSATKRGTKAPANAVASKKAQEQDEEARVAAEQAAAKDAEKVAKAAEKESKREAAAKEKAEAEAKARQAKIDSGDLIVVGDMEFESGTTATKTFGQVSEIIAALKASETPRTFQGICDEINAKYPEDLVTSMHALEQVGLVRRFDGKDTSGTSNRRAASYQWVGDRS